MPFTWLLFKAHRHSIWAALAWKVAFTKICYMLTIPQYFLSLQIFLLCLSNSSNMTVENQRKFYKFLEKDICPYIKPKPDQRSPMVVDIDMALFSLISYDDTTGSLSSLIMMFLEWTDEFIENGNFSFE